MANCTITPESLSAQVFSLNSFPVVRVSFNEPPCLNVPSNSKVPSKKASSNKEPLSHLPTAKREQLQKAVEVILESAHRNNASKPSMLILFGSYARGNWIEGNWIDASDNWIEERVEKKLERGANDGSDYNYQSSFDILVVTKNEALAKKIERKDSLHNRLAQEVQTPVHLMAKDIYSMNRCIGKGQYFYGDIVREGVVLHDSGEYELAQPQVLHPAVRKNMAKADFEYWFGKAMTFKKSFRLHFYEGDYSEAAFLLHQIAERLYNAILLVFTHYKPNSHDLRKLSQYAASIEPHCLAVFPQTTKVDSIKFELLRSAYVNARYKRSFSITRQELEWLSDRVLYLQTLTEQLCQAKIASYG